MIFLTRMLIFYPNCLQVPYESENYLKKSIIVFKIFVFSTGILLTKKWLQNFHFVFNQHFQLALAKSIVNYSCDYCMQYTYIHVLLKKYTVYTSQDFQKQLLVNMFIVYEFTFATHNQ